MKYLIILLVLVLLTGCASTVITKTPEGELLKEERVSPDNPKQRLDVLFEGILYSGVYRISDKEKGVTCWLFESGKGDGISCLPASQLSTNKTE